MSFINTRDVIGDQAVLDGLVADTLTELKEDAATTIGSYALYERTALERVELPNVNVVYSAYSAKSVNVFYGCTSLTAAILPSTTLVSNNMFSGCSSLSTLDISSATRIGQSAFANCTSLTSISSSKVTTVERSAFYGCTALTTVNLPKAAAFAQQTFYGCSSLSSVTLKTSDTNNTIGENCFKNCTSLTSIDFPNTSTLGSFAFDGCTNLRSVNLPNITVATGQYAFRNVPCGSLELPKATSFGAYLTNGLGATEVDIGTSGVTSTGSIVASAFGDSLNLFSLILRGSTVRTLVNTNALTGTPIRAGYGKIYVPNDLVDSYKSASNWSTFASQIESLNNYNGAVPTGGETITDSWAEIFEAERDGTYDSKYSLGDTKWLPYDTYYILMELVGKDRDDLSDNTGKAKLTWLCKGWYWNHRMNPTKTNEGGWAESEMRSWLISDVLPKIDQSVRENIVSVKKQSYGSVTTDDLIWIPSHYEVSGLTKFDSGGCIYRLVASDTVRTRYKAWTQLNAAKWFLRTANTGGTSFIAVATNGATATSSSTQFADASDSTTAAVFGFCT